MLFAHVMDVLGAVPVACCILIGEPPFPSTHTDVPGSYEDVQFVGPDSVDPARPGCV